MSEDTPNAPTPTTPATAEQLRRDADLYRIRAAGATEAEWTERHTRAAAALDAEAARREAPHAELRGWGVMRPDGTLMPRYSWEQEPAQRTANSENFLAQRYGRPAGYRAVPVLLTTEGAE
jgi:hypothetical protein